MKKDNLDFTLLSLLKDYLKPLKLDNQILFDPYLEFPSQTDYGDISVSLALKLSKILKKPPQMIADSMGAYLDKKIKDTIFKEYIANIQIAGGGFINFFLTDDYFRKVLREILILGDNFARSNLGLKRKVLVEFVSANPTGPLSIAHARQAAVGGALCNILESLGFRPEREYYLNDEGRQIHLLGKSIEARFRELQGGVGNFQEGGYEGEYIRDIAKKIYEQTAILRKVQDTSLNDAERSRSISDQQLAAFSDYGVKYILKIIKHELKEFGVKFDSWYSQKRLTRSGKIKKSLTWLRQKGFIYEKDGAVWFKSTAFGDDKDRVLIKNDNTYTYIASDIAYHKDKYQRGFNWLINLWGPDHHGYIGRLKAAIQSLGKDLDSLSIIIVQLATIFKNGKPLPMSTRKGQYITLREILDEVGSDASHFFFLMRRTSAHLDFDLELAKKQTSDNPVYYVQYAHARICSIMRNAQFKPKVSTVDLHLLKEPEELRLMKRLWQFPRILEVCYRNLDPYFVTVYLQEVAEDLHKFYERHRVLTEDKNLTKARLALILAARIVLNKGLKLIGVSSPESM